MEWIFSRNAPRGSLELAGLDFQMLTFERDAFMVSLFFSNFKFLIFTY